MHPIYIKKIIKKTLQKARRYRQRIMKLQKTTNIWFLWFLWWDNYPGAQKTNNLEFFFRMMERSSGVKGIFVLATAGVLECLVTFPSDNGVSTAKKWMVITTVPHQISSSSHGNGNKVPSSAEFQLHQTFPYSTCLFTSPLTTGGKNMKW